MSIVTAHQQVDFRNIVDPGNPTVTRSSTLYSETEGGYTWNIRGEGLQYGSDGYIAGGSVHSMDTLQNGQAHFSIDAPAFVMGSNFYSTGWSFGTVRLTGMNAEFAGWLSGDDTINGSTAADVLSGFDGSDRIDAGSGTDTVVLYGSRSSFEVTRNADQTVTTRDMTGSQGVDTLLNVERLQFSDGVVAFDTAGNAGMAYRLYQAAFNRTPDTGGLGFQTSALDQGLSINQVAGNFINSPEFQSLYGALNNEQFVTQLYQNVLHRAPDPDGFAYWTNNLERGYSRADVLVGFSESTENQGALIGTIQNGMFFTV